MNVHFIIHERFEAPGAAKDWAVENGHTVTHTHLSNGEKLPDNVDNIDLLVVCGGPQSTKTTQDECPYFNAQAEINLIKQAADQGKKVLGICLGAQLMSEAFGGIATKSPEVEVGVYPVSLTEEGKKDPYFSQFEPTFDVAHWHEDMPGLPNGAVVLAKSAGCPRQIIRFAPNAYGFQCHFEFSMDCLEALIDHSQEALADVQGRRFVETSEELVNHDLRPINDRIKQFLSAFTD